MCDFLLPPGIKGLINEILLKKLIINTLNILNTMNMINIILINKSINQQTKTIINQYNSRSQK